MYLRQVLVQSFQSGLVLVFEGLVQLMVPVLTPCPHVVRPEALNTSTDMYKFPKEGRGTFVEQVVYL